MKMKTFRFTLRGDKVVASVDGVEMDTPVTSKSTIAQVAEMQRYALDDKKDMFLALKAFVASGFDSNYIFKSGHGMVFVDV